MRTATRQANFTLPEDLLDELRRAVPRGEQSRVVGEALRNELTRIRFRRALDQSFGAWSRSRHPELADCLIAATAFTEGASLATGNVKDYPIPELTVLAARR